MDKKTKDKCARETVDNSERSKDNIIAIDGPAGSGKSTIAKLLSKRLGLKYIDTGAMYRTVTLLAIENGLEPDDEESILNVLKRSKIELESSPDDSEGYTAVILNGNEVTDKIRTKEIGSKVSLVSRLSGIRKYLVNMQRDLAIKGKAVLEGRDIGTVVCPGAILKIYLTADLEARVKRREKQDIEKNKQAVDQKSIKNEIQDRDRIDSTREDSPLMTAEDAVIIDNSNISIEETYEKIKDLYFERTCNKD